jgi:hypothetical protein
MAVFAGFREVKPGGDRYSMLDLITQRFELTELPACAGLVRVFMIMLYYHRHVIRNHNGSSTASMIASKRPKARI